MADAYARLSGKVGIALVTGRQGHTNACAALATSLASEAPMILLSAMRDSRNSARARSRKWPQATVKVRRRLINGVAGAIGPSLPFALAAKAACPGQAVLAAMGDGTFGFHMAEFDTAARHGLPVIVVGNDARSNAEYQIQLREYGAGRTIGCELLPTRYDKVVEALGGHGEHVATHGELAPALARRRQRQAGLHQRDAAVDADADGAALGLIRRACRSMPA